MKAIIAGGRDYILGPEHFKWLDKIHSIDPITEVISGGASGADAGGEAWATKNNIKVTVFKADWSKGKQAGPMRNCEMAMYAKTLKGFSLCILFSGGKGTANMKATAQKHGLVIIEYTPLA